MDSRVGGIEMEQQHIFPQNGFAYFMRRYRSSALLYYILHIAFSLAAWKRLSLEVSWKEMGVEGSGDVRYLIQDKRISL